MGWLRLLLLLVLLVVAVGAAYRLVDDFVHHTERLEPVGGNAQGIRCLGTDGPTLGGVDPEVAREVDWLAGSEGIVVVEMLTGLEAITGRDAFFLFAPIKIAGTRGGYGRALALVEEGPRTKP